MSAYNGEKYIREQIDSILVQRADFELDLWVRDDGSEDGTQAILDEYAKEGLLQWYTGINLRPAYSFMDLVKHCNGYDYYAFADQDDVWDADKLKRGINAIAKQEKPILYFSNVRLVDADLNDLGRNAYKETPRTDFYTLSCAGGLLGCSMVFNDKLAKLLQEKPIPEKIVMHDFYLALVCQACGGEILYEEKPSMKYRQHDGNVVGVSYGLLRKIKSRIAGITKKAPVSIADQARMVADAYGDMMDEEKLAWLKGIAIYRNSVSDGIRLAFSPRVKYINFNMGLKNRMAILLRNR